jgi:hypothetical protein
MGFCSAPQQIVRLHRSAPEDLESAASTVGKSLYRFVSAWRQDGVVDVPEDGHPRPVHPMAHRDVLAHVIAGAEGAFGVGAIFSGMLRDGSTTTDV